MSRLVWLAFVLSFCHSNAQSTDRSVRPESVDETPIQTPATEHGPSIGGGEIAGIVVGSVGFLALLAIACSLYVRHWRQSKLIDSDSEDIEQQGGEATPAPKSFNDAISPSEFGARSDGHTTDDEMVSDSPHQRSRSRSYSSTTYSLSSRNSSNNPSHPKEISVNDLCVEISDDESPSTPSHTVRALQVSVVTVNSVSPLPSPRPSPRPVRNPSVEANVNPVSNSSMLSSSCGSMSSSSTSASLFSSPSFASQYFSSNMQPHQYFNHNLNQMVSPSSPNTLTIYEAKFDQDFDDAEQDELERERQLRSLFQSLRIDDWHMRAFLSNGIGVNELTKLTPTEIAQLIPSLRPRRFLLQYINERNGVSTPTVQINDQTIHRNVAFDTGRYRQPNTSPTASVTFTPWSHVVSSQHVSHHHRTRAASITLAPVTTSVSVTDGADALASQSGTHTPISTGSGSEAITHVSRSTFEVNSPTIFSTSSRTNYAQITDYPDSQLARTVSVSVSQAPSINDRHHRQSQAIPAYSVSTSQIRASSSRPVSRPRSTHQSVTAAGRSQRDFEPSIIHASQVFSILSQHRYYDQTEESQFEYSTQESQHRTALEEEEKDG